MTRPVNLEEVVAELSKRVTALEEKVGKPVAKEDPNLLARLPREERRARLGLSHLHEGKPDERDIIHREDPEIIVVTPPIKSL